MTRHAHQRNSLKILQHNVNTWNEKRHSLVNIYNEHDPDIILINDHSLKGNERVKIFNYNTHQSNKTNGNYRGTAIAIKKT